MPVTQPDGTVLESVTLPSGHRQVTAVTVRDGMLPEPPPLRKRAGTVNWYVPYTYVHPLTVQAAPKGAVWVDVSASDNAYYTALRDIWEQRESFAVLEHDVVCRPDVVDAFEECPEPWCIYGYSNICHPGCMEAWRNALGCTRFRAEILEAVPDAVSSIAPEAWDWHNLCDGIGNNLRAAGFTHHWHEPWVHHHQNRECA